MLKFKAIAKQHPTEDSQKVSLALQTLLDGEILSESIGNDIYLSIESHDSSSLMKIYDYVRKHRILDVFRKTLRNSIIGNGTVFYVNKQAAFVGRINVCEEKGESPLGPIRVEIEYEDINHLIDWLAPYTKNGREVTLVSHFP